MRITQFGPEGWTRTSVKWSYVERRNISSNRRSALGDCEQESAKDSTEMLRAQVNSLEKMKKDLMSVVQSQVINSNRAANVENEHANIRINNERVNAFESVLAIAFLLSDFNPRVDTSVNSIQ